MAEMSQDDIDALLSGAVSSSPPKKSQMGQDDIDALLGGGSSGSMGQDDIDALLSGGGGSSGPIGQDDIDALLSGGGKNSSMGQNDIDALLGGGGKNSSMGQNDIDALLGGGGSDSMGQSSIDALFGSGGGSMDDMHSLLSEIQNDPNLGQVNKEVNLDDLLTEIQSTNASGGVSHHDLQSLMDSVPQTGAMMVPGEAAEESVNIDFLLDMRLTVTFEVGRAKMLIGDLLSLGQGSVIELHRLVGEDLDLFVSEKLIAKGEVVVVNEKFGVRILDIVSPEDRIKHLSGLG